MKNRLLKIVSVLVQALLCPNVLRSVFALTFLAIVACTDQGCIDADDFGEYESQTIKVQANAAKEVCTYDTTKDLTDPAQGSGLKSCFTYDTVTIDDGSGNSQTSNKGCNGIVNSSLRQICLQNCVNRCLNNSSGGSDGAEPAWTSTDKKVPGKNIGVTIVPYSEISIRSVGFINLGDSIDYSGVYVSPVNPIPHSYNKEWMPSVFDIKNGQSLILKFSGQWTDGPANYGDGNTDAVTVGSGSSDLSSAESFKIYNAANRAVIYAIPHPSGYDFDGSQTNEKGGSKNVPLLPDPDAWTCNYSSSGDKKQSVCQSLSYKNIGYSAVDDSLANSTFPISSEYRAASLGKFGGAIRWNNDGIEDASFDPFAKAGVACDSSGQCSNMGGVTPEAGVIAGDLGSSGKTITNSYSSSYQVSFRFLADGCDTTLSSVSVTNPASGEQYDVVSNLEVKKSAWTTIPISLEPNHNLSISTLNRSIGSVNCGKFLAVRFLKYQDIKVERSGFVKFATLGVTPASGECRLSGRIINPEGNHREFSAQTSSGSTRVISQDFYEYDNLNSDPSRLDPLTSLLVNFSSSTPSSWSSAIYVRKGQIIRLNPSSWNNSWAAVAKNNLPITRQCGAGMVMHIDPRPALLCRGKSTSLVDNPNCSKVYESGQLVGCEISQPPACFDSSSSSYCPALEGNFKISCAPGSASNNFARNCTFPIKDNPGNLTPAQQKCYSCAQSTADSGSVAAKQEIPNIDRCYDLENYKGSVVNIPNTGSKALLDDFINTSSLAKGATLLGVFSGNYGNLSSFATITSSATVSGKPIQQVDAGNTIYQLSTPVTSTMGARLKFFVLDGENFNDTSNPNPILKYYSNNSGQGLSYNGQNGIKIYPSSTMEFANGDMLQVRLCQEPSDDSNSFVCKSINPASVSGQPLLIENSLDLSGANPKTLYSGNYKFNSYGTLTRSSATQVPGDCLASNGSLYSPIGSQNYCHTLGAISKGVNDPKACVYGSGNVFANVNQGCLTEYSDKEVTRLRLSFKIFDPEIGDDICGGNSRIKLKNPYYKDGDSSNAGGLCMNDGSQSQTPGDGTSTSYSIGANSYANCQKEFFCANKYQNNSGEYYVNVRVKNPTNKNISNIIAAVIKPIVELMDGTPDDLNTQDVNEYKMGQAERVYKLLIADPRYKAILTMTLVLMLTFYGLGYLMGISELKHDEIIGRIIKIGVVYLFVGETGWYWFNKIVVQFFKDGTNYLAFMMASAFDDSPALAQAIDTQTFTDKSVLFTSIDKVLSLFFSSVVQKKISALLFASIFGWAYVLVIYYSFLLYLYAVANAVLLYLTSQVFISILFVLGPIFFIFLFFSQTKEMFDNWLKQLIGFSLQQIFLLTTLAFFNMLIYEVIKMSLGYKICWDDVWTINIITRVTLLSFWTVAALPPSSNMQSDVGNIGNPEGIPSLFSILFIWVITSLMGQFITFMTDLAARISGGLSASELGKGVADAVGDVGNKLKEIGGKVWDKTGGNLIKRADHALFDSGENAEKARKEAEAKNERDLSNRSSMVSAGNKAVEEFKKNNANELIGKSQKEQRDKLKQVKQDAMMKEADKLGISQEEAKKLLSETGLKYEGSNVFGAVASAIRQGTSEGGALFTAEKDKEVDPVFSADEAREAMENMNQEDRKKFIESAKKGKINVVDRRGSIAKKFDSFANSVSEAVDFDGEYDSAAKELELEGEIDTMRYGFGWSRSSEDKNKIEERRKANVEKKKLDKLSSASVLKDLEAQNKYITRKEKLEGERLSEDRGAITHALESAGNYFDTSVINPNRDSEEIEEKYKNYDSKARQEQIESAHKDAEERRDKIYKSEQVILKDQDGNQMMEGNKLKTQLVETGKLVEARDSTNKALDKIRAKYGDTIADHFKDELEIRREELKGESADSNKINQFESSRAIRKSSYNKAINDINDGGINVDYKEMLRDFQNSSSKEFKLNNELNQAKELANNTQPHKPKPENSD